MSSDQDCKGVLGSQFNLLTFICHVGVDGFDIHRVLENRLSPSEDFRGDSTTYLDHSLAKVVFYPCFPPDTTSSNIW